MSRSRQLLTRRPERAVSYIIRKYPVIFALCRPTDYKIKTCAFLFFWWGWQFWGIKLFLTAVVSSGFWLPLCCGNLQCSLGRKQGIVVIQGIKEDIFSLTLKCIGDHESGRWGGWKNRKQFCNPRFKKSITVVQVLASSNRSTYGAIACNRRIISSYWPTMRVWRAQTGLANQRASPDPLF